MRSTFALLFTTIFILTGCNIEQTFVFNEDFSGEMTQSIDYSGSKDLMEMDSTTVQNEEITLLPDSVIQEISAEMDNIQGAHLISMWDEDYKLNMKISFDHLEALNEAVQLDSGDSTSASVFCQFRKNKKSVFVDFVVDDEADVDEESDDSADELEMNMDGLYAMVLYRFEFRFAQKIKSVSGTAAIVQEDEKSVVVEQSMQKIMAPDFDRTLEIRFK